MSDSILFQAARIGSLKLSNRFIRSATWEGLAAPDGACTDELVRLMEGLAEGGVGIIVSSHAFVRPEGYALRGQLGIHRDDLITGLARMADAVHLKGGRIIMQLAHGGLLAGTQLRMDDQQWPQALLHVEQNRLPHASHRTAKEMSRREISTPVVNRRASCREVGEDPCQAVKEARRVLFGRSLQIR